MKKFVILFAFVILVVVIFFVSIASTEKDEKELRSLLVESFQTQIVYEATERIGKHEEGFTASMFVDIFPGLFYRDFDGVEVMVGVHIYDYDEGLSLIFSNDSPPVLSDYNVISDKGYETLFHNITQRSGSTPETEDDLIEIMEWIYNGTQALVVDLSDCNNYFDGCNNCSVDNSGMIICTEIYCLPEEMGIPKCLD